MLPSFATSHGTLIKGDGVTRFRRRQIWGISRQCARIRSQIMGGKNRRGFGLMFLIVLEKRRFFSKDPDPNPVIRRTSGNTDPTILSYMPTRNMTPTQN